MKKIFEDIIKHHRWRDVLCGSGSTIAYTKMLRDQLPKLVAEYGISSMLDAPCGDFSWMNLVEFPKDFRYIGADIVEPMILSNREKYPQIQFEILDISTDPIPSVDMIFVRDCLIHLSNQDVLRVLDNIRASAVKYVMLTNYLPDHCSANDIQTGHFRGINMEIEPFNLPNPLIRLDDGPEGHVVKTMDLWSIDQLRGTA